MAIDPFRFARAIATLCLALWPQTGWSEPQLTFGVRSDAVPFSHAPDLQRHPQAKAGEDVVLPGSPKRNGYEGYIVDICEAALTNLSDRHSDLTIVTREVDAETRFVALEQGSIDVLCDPASVTDDRVRGLFASLPLYLSAITFAQPDPLPQGMDICRHVVGAVSQTTAEAYGISRILQNEGTWPNYRDQIRSALRAVGPSRQGVPVVSETCGDHHVIELYTTHTELAEAFCAGEILYYVGDVDILQRQLERETCMLDWTIAPATFSEERYAIFARSRDVSPETAAILLEYLGEVGRVVQSTPSIVYTAYDKNFQSFRPSEKLRIFFWSVAGPAPR